MAARSRNVRAWAATARGATSARRTGVPAAASTDTPRSQASMEAAAIFPARMASTAVRGPCCPSPPAKTPGTVVILVLGSAAM